jgi:hypothetical protein
MKKTFFTISLLIAIMVMATGFANAQFPLIEGDAMVTHSPATNHWTYDSSGIVLRHIRTSNTTTANFYTSWNSPVMFPAGLKPPNHSNAAWRVNTLGTIFGITLDAQPNPNVYVSSTQIYTQATSHARKIYRIDGISEAPLEIFNFGDAERSLGNLKYQRIGTTENIYVSDFKDGRIYRLTSTSSTTWVSSGSLTLSGNTNHFPYGLALRKMPGGVYRLYFAEVESTYPYGTDKLYYTNLDAAGNFTGAVQTITTPSLTLPPLNWPGYVQYFNNVPVISDLAFSADGKRMLIGQQTWVGSSGSLSNPFATIAPHNAQVIELVEQGADNWINSPSSFPAGNAGNGARNSAGGVSYSNNILQKGPTDLKCDTTVWFTSDFNSVPGAMIYGIQGMRSSGGTQNSSISIDEDENVGIYSYDKNYLGDVEVYKKPLICPGAPCGCGSWGGNPTLNGDLIPAVPVDIHIEHMAADAGEAKTLPTGPIGPPIFLVNYPVQFVQGNATGLINANYQCTGDCNTTYTWSIVNTSNVTVASGTTLPIDLSKYNTPLTCGKYNLVIKAKCGNSKCGSQTIPITIICEPPVDCCKAAIDVDLVSKTVYPVINLPNPGAYSSARFTYNMQYNLPMSEVRVSVEEFRLSSTSPNCLNCSNRPVTWSNILGADINGTPLTLTGAGGIPTGSVQADYREAVYNTGTPLMPSAAALRIKLSLPAITELSCCEVYAYVCLKFTFKDIQCRECVQMVCGKILLVAPPVVTDTHGGPRSDKIEVKKFKVKY